MRDMLESMDSEILGRGVIMSLIASVGSHHASVCLKGLSPSFNPLGGCCPNIT